MAVLKSWKKDPSDVLDYSVNWTSWLLDGDTISASTWAVEAGITIDSESETTTVATVWLSGGTAGTTYTVTNEIVTTDGRTAQRSIYIVVADR